MIRTTKLRRLPVDPFEREAAQSVLLERIGPGVPLLTRWRTFRETRRRDRLSALMVRRFTVFWGDRLRKRPVMILVRRREGSKRETSNHRADQISRRFDLPGPIFRYFIVGIAK